MEELRKEVVDGEHVIALGWCSRRTGNGSYDSVKPDKANEELRKDTALTIVA